MERKFTDATSIKNCCMVTEFFLSSRMFETVCLNNQRYKPENELEVDKLGDTVICTRELKFLERGITAGPLNTPTGVKCLINYIPENITDNATELLEAATYFGNLSAAKSCYEYLFLKQEH